MHHIAIPSGTSNRKEDRIYAIDSLKTTGPKDDVTVGHNPFYKVIGCENNELQYKPLEESNKEYKYVKKWVSGTEVIKREKYNKITCRTSITYHTLKRHRVIFNNPNNPCIKTKEEIIEMLSK